MSTYLRSSGGLSLVMASQLILAALIACPSTALAQGRLDAFEKDANLNTQGRPQDAGPGAKSHDHDCDHDHDAGNFWIAEFIRAFFSAIPSTIEMTHATWQRAEDRSAGEPLLPSARLDITGHSIDSDVTALDVCLEAGRGPFALNAAWTHFRENQPADGLDIVHVLATYRMCISRYEVDAGLGTLSLSGEESTTRLAFSLPILIHPTEHLGLEFRPTWTDRVRDYDLTVMLTWNHVSLKAGYRWLHTPNEALDGPFIGLSMRL